MEIKDFETTGSVYVVGRHFCWPPQYIGSNGCGRWVWTGKLGEATVHKTVQEAALARDKVRERGVANGVGRGELEDLDVLRVMLKVGAV